MKKSSVEQLAELQKNAANIRNICILAHVDHGKTTLADSLVASNGIISQRMAGKLRYLDSREDEQTRGITMKSSAISLHFEHANEDFLINLIDSPGHIDFSCEVSTAVRLCDGAVVLIDVIEGICPQTQAVLRQAWLENIKPVLVLNKVDRLITEWKFTPQEAQIHLQQILEQVNAVTGELFTSEVLAKSSMASTSKTVFKPGEDQVFDWSSGLEETDDSNLYFSPEGGNVAFASAIDGWGFRLDQFAELYARKVGVSARVLGKTLWGDYYLDAKTKTVKKGAQAKNKKTLFVQLILENIWKIYDVILVRRDKELAEKIVQTLGVTIKIQMKDVRLYLQSLMNQWLPLSCSILAMVCEKLPSPLQMSEERVEKLLCASSQRFDSLPAPTQLLKNDFLSCSSSDDAPVIVFVSKMFTIESSALPGNRARPLTVEEIQQRRELLRSRKCEKSENQTDLTTNETTSTDGQEVCLSDGKQRPDDHVFVAFARIYSGKIKKGQTLYVLGPKHDPAKALQEMGDISAIPSAEHIGQLKHVSAFHIDELYMFMGRELEFLNEIPAGNVLGIGGLKDYVLKSATIASTVACPSFSDMYLEATPIVRVAIEPRNTAEMKQLVHGLKLLNQSDPCVEIMVQETGEHIVTAAGEVHLQKCLDDLRYRFAKIEIDVSAPAVPFRETIIPRPVVDRVNEIIQGQQTSANAKSVNRQDLGIVEMSTVNGLATIRVRSLPLPQNVTKLLEDNVPAIKTLNQYNTGKSETIDLQKISEETLTVLKELKAKLASAFGEAGDEFPKDIVNHIWSFGPKRNCTNVLVNKADGYDRPSVWSLLDCNLSKSPFRQYDSSVVGGFQIATQAGPLCEEPMMGVCFIIEKLEMNDTIGEKFNAYENTFKSSSDNVAEESTNAVIDSFGSVNDRPFGNVENCDVQTESNETRGTDLIDDSNEKEIVGSMEEISVTGFDMKRTQFRGQLISCVKECCRRSFQMHPQRLMWAMYSCVIQATADVLGKMYAVLGKRNGRVLYEDMKEGTSIFNIVALIPVAESFGLADEIRKRTSGLASPQLKFSHWEVIDIDPFWVPTTEEEYLHFGEKADTENVACKHMNAVRRRKGLQVNEKIVEFGEKQRTLKKNK